MFAGLTQTTLLAGSSFNVTWHLAYPHRVSFDKYIKCTLQRNALRERKLVLRVVECTCCVYKYTARKSQS